MFIQRIIAFVFSIIALTSFAQGRLWNRGTIQLDAGTEVRVHGNIQLDSPITGDGYLVYAGNNLAYASGEQLQTDNFRMDSNSPLLLNNDFHITQKAEFTSGVLQIGNNDVFFHQSQPIVGGNSNAFIFTSGSGKVRFPVDTNTTLIPLGINANYIPTTFLQNGTSDTFSVQLWPALTDNGTVAGYALNTHVGLWALHIEEAVPGQNDMTLSIQWPDGSLAADFFEQQSVLIRYDGTGYVPLLLCGTDLSAINPNTLLVPGLANVGVFGAGDSLYLPPQPQATISAFGSTSFCQGDSVLLQASVAANYIWNNGASTQQIYASTAGWYQVTVTDSNGCQSVSSPIQVIVYPPDQVTITQTACDEFVWDITGQTYTTDGNYSATLQNQNGCDSTITLQLSLKHSITYNQNFSICPGSSVTVGNNTYDSSGTYTDVLVAQNGCDSTVITVISVLDCSGWQHESEVSIQMYPNPAKDWIMIVSSEAEIVDLLVQILTVHGQLIYHELIHLQPSTPEFIPVNHLASGSYFLRLGNKVMPFLKQ